MHERCRLGVTREQVEVRLAGETVATAAVDPQMDFRLAGLPCPLLHAASWRVRLVFQSVRTVAKKTAGPPIDAVAATSIVAEWPSGFTTTM